MDRRFAGAVAQATSSSRARSSEPTHRPSPLLDHPAHLELAVLDREGEPAFDEVERVLAELLVAPALKDIEILADAGGERFEVVRASDQASRDAGLLRADLEQQLQQVADQSRVLGQAGSPAVRDRAIRRSSGLAASIAAIRRAPMSLDSPSRRQATDPAEILLRLGRMENDLRQRVVLDDAPTRQVLPARFGLAPGREA